jgi:SecD/SecF fusion protein
VSFTFISTKIQQDAIDQATDKSGSINLVKKQNYLDSLWNKPVYNLFGAEYTYKEVKESELSRGLDLQGGMHVVLEISPIDIIRGLSGNNQDPAFVAALQKARELQKTSSENFSALFFKAFKDANPDKTMASLFTSAANKDRVKLSDDDATVMKFLNDEIESAIKDGRWTPAEQRKHTTEIKIGGMLRKVIWLPRPNSSLPRTLAEPLISSEVLGYWRENLKEK